MKIPASVLALVSSFICHGNNTVTAFSPPAAAVTAWRGSGSGSPVALLASNPPDNKVVLEGGDDASVSKPLKARKRDIIRGWVFERQLWQRRAANEDEEDSTLKEVMSQAVEVKMNFITTSEEAGQDNSDDSKVQTIISQIFTDADKDNSGGLDRWEVYDALTELDYDVSPETCLALLREFDANSNGYLEVDEFASLVNDKVGKDVSAVYAMFANERDGMLSSGALRRALEMLGVDLNAKKTKSLLVQYDHDGDGKLGLLGFADLVAASPIARFWLAVDKSGTIRDARVKALNVLTKAPKKPVSVHSLLSGWSIVLLFSAYLRLFNPHIVEFNGANIPVLFDFFSKGSEGLTIHQFQASMIALSITSLMGIYRLPPNSPFSRRVYFWTCAVSVVQSALLLSSNLIAGEFGLFNAFDAPWNYILNGAGVLTQLTLLAGLDDAISGPDGGRKGLPTESGIGMAVFNYIMYIFNIVFFQVSLAPFYGNENMWASTSLSYLVENNLIIFPCTAPVTMGLITSLGALLATLKFEKKVDSTTAPLAVFAILALTEFDNIVQAYFLVLDQGPFGGTLMDYNNDVISHFHIFAVANFFVLLTVGNAFARRTQNENGQDIRRE